MNLIAKRREKGELNLVNCDKVNYESSAAFMHSSIQLNKYD